METWDPRSQTTPPPCPNCGQPLYYNTNGFHACAPSITVDTVLAVGKLTDERDALRGEVKRLREALRTLLDDIATKEEAANGNYFIRAEDIVRAWQALEVSEDGTSE